MGRRNAIVADPTAGHDEEPKRFGLDRGAPRTLRAVADQLELKPSRLAQIEKRALERLRAARE